MRKSGEQFLTQYARTADEKAFREFADLYLGLIYHTAFRRTSSRTLAEEVSQNVLCAVAKKAEQVAKNPELIAPWLHRATTFEANKIMRSEKAYQRRKELRHPHEESDIAEGEGLLGEALPYLDEALNSLSSSDRAVVLGHYFQGEPFKSLGARMNKPAGTLQKQCRRALQKMERILRKKGVVLSGLGLASILGTEFAKAAPPSLIGSTATAALAGKAAYSSSTLTFSTLGKSKTLLGAATAVLCVPLVWQQVEIQRASAENTRLRDQVVQQERPKSTRTNSTVSHTTGQGMPNRKVTIETIRQAYLIGQQDGGIKLLEFEELVASLSQEDLERMLPEAYKMPGDKEVRRKLTQEFIESLVNFDPEKAVRMAWELNPEAPFQIYLGLPRAAYQWAEKDPDGLVSWIREVTPKVRELSQRDEHSWWWFSEYVSASLSSLIETRSPHVRELLEMEPLMSAKYLVREAIERPGFPSGMRTRGVEPQEVVVTQIDRFVAFLPWIREFVPTKEGNSGDTQRELLGRLVFENQFFGHETEREFFNQLVNREELTNEERAWVVHEGAQEILEGHFNGSDQREWQDLLGEANQWLAQFDEEGAEEWLGEIQEKVFANERFQIENHLEVIERQQQVRDFELEQTLLKRDYDLFPEFRERALKQANRIKDTEMRREVLEHIEQ